ncbi:hypothetical protein B0F90DRAFT_1802314, partial [Multifurca ochricompacta]
MPPVHSSSGVFDAYLSGPGQPYSSLQPSWTCWQPAGVPPGHAGLPQAHYLPLPSQAWPLYF